MSLLYSRVEPTNVKSTYGEYDTLDFEIVNPGRFLLANGIRVEADVRVKQNNANIVAEDILLDPLIGAHSFISNITCETQNQGLLETISDYPRMIRMESSATLTKEDCFSGQKCCEMRTGGEQLSKALLRGVKNISSGATVPVVNADNDFSIRPHFCLNNVSGDTNIDLNKTGTIRISVELNRVFAALYGRDVGATTSYTLSDVRLCYTSRDTSAASGTTTMRTKVCLKSSINSSFANISTKVPAVCDAVSVSFQQQARENQSLHNNVRLEQLPSVTDLQFLFQDSTNKYITYQIRDRAELLNRYLESLRTMGHNNASLATLKGNDSYGIGLSFNGFIDLSMSKFNIQVQSGTSNANAYVAYLYFHSVTSL